MVQRVTGWAAVATLVAALGGCAGGAADGADVFDVPVVGLDEGLGNEDTSDPGFASLRAPLTLNLTGSLSPGGVAVWEIGGLSPGENAKLAYSTNGIGAGPCPAALGGQCLDLLNAGILASANADAAGIARVQVPVGAGAPIGLQISTQAVAIRGVGGAQTVLSPARTDTITSERTDDFVHFPAAVDVLFVVDDSCSMAEEQSALSTGFTPMIDTILALGLDYHIGVISTDMASNSKSGKLQADNGGGLWIDPSDSNPSLSFNQMADLGTNGSAYEEGLVAITESLDTYGATFNLGFRRVTAQYAVVVLSDEEDQSPGGWSPYASRIASEAFHTGDVTFTSIVTPIGNCPTGSTVGNRYLNTTSYVGAGVTESICANDYSGALTELANSLWTSVPYELSALPLDPAGIAITADEATGSVALDAADWVYDPIDNTVRFTSAYHPPAGTDLHVAYEPL